MPKLEINEKTSWPPAQKVCVLVSELLMCLSGYSVVNPAIARRVQMSLHNQLFYSDEACDAPPKLWKITQKYERNDSTDIFETQTAAVF